MKTRMSIVNEIRPMLRLAWPLVLAEVGWMFMGVVDTIMVGHLPHPAVTISAAASVRVGQAIGRGVPREAAAAGWTAIGLGSGFMLCASATLVSIPGPIAAGFTHDPAVIAAAVPLLLVGAAFQFFDGVQVTATGALRGAGDTHAGLVVQLIGYWAIGLPVGCWLGFSRHYGAVGLWIGLALGLIFAGFALLSVWWRTVRRGAARVA